MCDEENVRAKYAKITDLLLEKGKWITTMESCTSGMIASLLTDREGSSGCIKGAFVTYSNEAKVKIGVPQETIERYGVYSSETAMEMARTCRSEYQADIGIGVTGTLGNTDPNNADSVPGEVFFAIDQAEGTNYYHCKVPVQPSRHAYKIYMADAIADVLLELL